MRMILLSLLLLSIAFTAGGAAIPIPLSQFELRKDTVYRDGVFTVTIPKMSKAPNSTRGPVFQLDPKKFAGKRVIFRAEMRYRGIESDTTGRHIGGKILGVFCNKFGISSYTASRSLLGTNETWQEISYFCTYPAELKSAMVVFGIQQAWGMLEFRNPTMEILPEKTEKKKFSVSSGFQCEYSPAVANRPRMRGMMSPVPDRITEEDIRELGRWKVNLLRYQITDGIKDLKDLTEYAAWMDRCLDKLESLLPVLKQNGIRVIIDMHRAPGGRYKENALLGTAGRAAAEAYGNRSRFLMMEESAFREAFLRTWKRIAARFKGNPAIYGYDLINEPDQRGPAKFDYLELQYDAAKAIREIDPETPIIVESNNWCGPLSFEQLLPLPFKNIIYQVHMYEPGPYTHQGVGDLQYQKNYPARVLTYPGDGCNREHLLQTLQPVINFQKKYGAKILVGEFSVTAWAPGGACYLKDVINIFEANNWDWTYHAFREWEGWSVEHAGAPKNLRPAKNSDRKGVLLEYFSRN